MSAGTRSTLERSPDPTGGTPMTSTTAPVRPASSLSRIVALARLEMTMLVRNSTALFNALALGPLMVVLIGSFQLDQAGDDRVRLVTTLLGTLVVFALTFASYYNLCTTAVARREEYMLKRLTTGEVTRAEVLIATAVPPLAIILAQVVLGGVAVLVLVGTPSFVNPLLVVLGLLLGFVTLAVLGYATSIITRSVEAAQVTTLLPLSALIFLSGATLPMSMMPEPMRIAAELSPLGATFQLITLGISGTTSELEVLDLAGTFGAALLPVVVLAVWSAAGCYLIAKRMAWEPRR